MRSEQDEILKKTIRKIRLESPGSGFSERVVKAILADSGKVSPARTEPFLGKAFWMVTILFIMMAGMFLLIRGSSPVVQEAESGGTFTSLMRPVLTLMAELVSGIRKGAHQLPVFLAAVSTAVATLLTIDCLFATRSLQNSKSENQKNSSLTR